MTRGCPSSYAPSAPSGRLSVRTCSSLRQPGFLPGPVRLHGAFQDGHGRAAAPSSTSHWLSSRGGTLTSCRMVGLIFCSDYLASDCQSDSDVASESTGCESPSRWLYSLGA